MNNQALKKHVEQIKTITLTQLFQDSPNRYKELSVTTDQVYFDFSRQLVTPETIKLLIQLANEQKLKEKIANMFAGEKINKTENRSVLHVALRSGQNKEVQAVLARIEAFSKKDLIGATGKKLKNIVAIGIGGSYLGPDYLATALRPFSKRGVTLRFVANVDGTDFVEKTADLDPQETLVIVISKTFTTAETMQNANTAKAWMIKGLNNHPEAVKKHFIAVSTAREEVQSFGIDPENMFGFWDWVGGRFSATSAVGAVPLSLYLGFDNFQKILDGANWLDEHFRNEPFEKNIPVLSALIDIWNINFLGLKTRALLPYSQGLSKLPAHTQQVEMESNGKLVDSDGKPVDFQTGEVVFGEAGTNGQHSFYQLLHQGTSIIPSDFIGFIKPQYKIENAAGNEVSHHEELMTNFLAQPDALAFGHKDEHLAKNFPGNRPSSSFLLKELTPFTTGLLLAWTEHRAAAKGFVWNINSFDQFGVQLGKVLGKDHRRRMIEFNKTGKINVDGLNPSTAKLLTDFLG